MDDRIEQYRDVYLRQKLGEMKVSNDEMETALTFVNERTDEDDGNLEYVLQTLDSRMRLQQRQAKRSYADPSAGNSGRGKTPKKDLRKEGAKSWKRVRSKVRK